MMATNCAGMLALGPRQLQLCASLSTLATPLCAQVRAGQPLKADLTSMQLLRLAWPDTAGCRSWWQPAWMQWAFMAWSTCTPASCQAACRNGLPWPVPSSATLTIQALSRWAGCLPLQWMVPAVAVHDVSWGTAAESGHGLAFLPRRLQ